MWVVVMVEWVGRGRNWGWDERVEKAQFGKRQNENLSQTHTKKAKPVAFNLCAIHVLG